VLYSRSKLCVFLVVVSLGAMAGVSATFGDLISAAHTQRAHCTEQQTAATLCAAEPGALDESPSSHGAAQSDLNVADEDSPDEKLLGAKSSGAVPRAFASLVAACSFETLVSHEPALALERPPRA
jgi:hypothetical protein